MMEKFEVSRGLLSLTTCGAAGPDLHKRLGSPRRLS